jgi:hypothetical protein
MVFNDGVCCIPFDGVWCMVSGVFTRKGGAGFGVYLSTSAGFFAPYARWYSESGGLLFISVGRALTCEGDTGKHHRGTSPIKKRTHP